MTLVGQDSKWSKLWLQPNSRKNALDIWPHPNVFTRYSNSNTVWKIRNISITQILREVNFGESRSAKSAILTHLETPKIAENVNLELLISQKLISRKI